AASIRCAICRYGSPHDGRNGLRSLSQCSGWRSTPSPTATRWPWKMLSASINWSSTSTSRPCGRAISAAVSCARCRGDAMTCVTSWSRRYSATIVACRRPASESPNPGIRPYSTPVGLYTSPCRIRCTTVRVIWPSREASVCAGQPATHRGVSREPQLRSCAPNDLVRRRGRSQPLVICDHDIHSVAQQDRGREVDGVERTQCRISQTACRFNNGVANTDVRNLVERNVSPGQMRQIYAYSRTPHLDNEPSAGHTPLTRPSRKKAFQGGGLIFSPDQLHES